jgi:RNase H-fold protein (predicted Holliday junction resolvase)
MKNSKMITWTDPVQFNGETYARRVIHVNGFGDRIIAGTSLQEELLTEDGTYVSAEAQLIDEEIFFYIEDKYLNCSDMQLAKYVLKQVA